MNHYFQWHYYPFYGAVFSSVLIYARFLKDKKALMNAGQSNLLLKTKNRVFFTYIFAFFLLLVLRAVFPVVDLDVPSGPYEVGTRIHEWKDESRLEVYGSNAGEEYRRIKVQAWYPAEDVEDFQRLPWIPEGRGISRSLASIFYFPPFILDQLEEIKSNSYLNAPVLSSSNPFPVVVLSHGWTGFRTLHTDLGELLASHGYFVWGIDHTYGAPAVIFEDGTQAKIDSEALPRRQDPLFFKYADKLINTYRDDITFVLDVLDESREIKVDDELLKSLDLYNIGLLGHSTGGGAGVKVGYRDPRVKGILGLDPWVEPFSAKEGRRIINAPFLFLRSEEWRGQNNDENLMRILNNNNHGQLFQIKGTTHLDFTMTHKFSSITSLVGLTGEIDRSRFEKIQEAFILNFFKDSLKVEGGGIDFIEEKYQEVYSVPFYNKND